MKSIALGAQQERDFMPQRRWNESLQEYVPILPSSTWSAGKTLVRCWGIGRVSRLSTDSETHRDFIRLVVRGFCEPSEITWEYNGYRGLDRAYVLEGFGVLKKVFALLEATHEGVLTKEQLKDAENRVVSALLLPRRRRQSNLMLALRCFLKSGTLMIWFLIRHQLFDAFGEESLPPFL